MHTLLVLTVTLLLVCPSGLVLPLLPSSPLLDSSSCHMCIITPPVSERSARTTKKVSENPVLELGLRSTMADIEAGIRPSLVPEVTEEEE